MAEEMFDNKPVKHGQRPGLVLIVIAIVIAVFFGLLGYYVGNKSQNTETVATPVAETTAIEEDTDEIASATTSSTTDETANWKNYANTKYNFGLTFNDKWTGLKVYDVKSTSSEDITPASDRFYYCIPTASAGWNDKISGYACPFAISVYTVSTYDSENQKAEQEEGMSAVAGKELGRNNEYVFVSSQWQDNPSDLVEITSDIKNITDSFKIK